MSKLSKILSISGRPGLYNLISQGKNCIIVESLSDAKKRIPVFNNEKVMSLGDIAIYTDTAEKPLGEIFETIKTKTEGKEVDIKALEASGKLREEFEAILPDYDKERVKNSDIKKVYNWFNTLVAGGITDFAEEETEETSEPASEEKEEK